MSFNLDHSDDAPSAEEESAIFGQPFWCVSK